MTTTQTGGVWARAAGLARQGWLVVAACFVILLILMGTSLYSFGVFVKPLAAEFGVGRAEVSAAFLIYTLTGAILGPFVGALVATRPVRLVMLAGAVLTVAGFLLLSTATAIWQVYLYFGVLVGAGNLLAGMLPCAAVVVNWFSQNRGTALGVTLFGASIGGPIFVPLATGLEVALGWRMMAVVFGLVTAVLLPAIIWLLIRDRPPGAPAPVKLAAGQVSPHKGLLKELLTDRRLWFAVGLMGFGTAPATAVIQSLHSHVTDNGYPPQTAALVVAGMTLLAAFSKPLFGRLADRFGLFWVILTALALQATALIILASLKGFVLLCLGVAFIGLGYGGLAPLVSLLLSTLFGPDRFPRVAGLLTTILLPFGLIGFPLAAFIQDRTGTYGLAYLIFVGFLATAAASLWQVRLARGEGSAPPPEAAS